jgi:diguanylate cyclase (GGDEF)-like protein
MRTIAKAASSSLVMGCMALALVVVAIAAIGIAGTRAATGLGNMIAGDELTTSTTTGQLARNMDAAYAAGEAALTTAAPATRASQLGRLYTSLFPTIDAELFTLLRLHADDPAAERNDIQVFLRQWNKVRDLLSPPALTGTGPNPALAAQVTAAYQPVSNHLSRLFGREEDDGRADKAAADTSSRRTVAFIAGVGALGIVIGVVILLYGIRRIRRSLVPGQNQAEFADTLQIANDEDEAQRLLRGHLERILTATTAVVLNRNNSADRLEAVTPLPSGSPLVGTLRGAEPRSCLALRSGRTHREDDSQSALLSCSRCVRVPGASSCVPLTVGGEVIGSVLLSRPTPYTDAEEEQIRESVSQAAPVLANLRNLAVAEIRAATDGLTGLPNKRAVTDAIKRTVAQASTTQAPLALLLIDLDHFKQINDTRGHAVGDQVLANVGAVLRAVLRAQDFAGRNGGEEFAILLPDTEIADALTIAERIRTAIAEISLPGTDVDVSASIGVAAFPDHASTQERLERLADAALYLAKRQGRNRVELATVDTAADLPELPVPSANGALAAAIPPQS